MKKQFPILIKSVFAILILCISQGCALLPDNPTEGFIINEDTIGVFKGNIYAAQEDKIIKINAFGDNITDFWSNTNTLKYASRRPDLKELVYVDINDFLRVISIDDNQISLEREVFNFKKLEWSSNGSGLIVLSGNELSSYIDNTILPDFELFQNGSNYEIIDFSLSSTNDLLVVYKRTYSPDESRFFVEFFTHSDPNSTVIEFNESVKIISCAWAGNTDGFAISTSENDIVYYPDYSNIDNLITYNAAAKKLVFNENGSEIGYVDYIQNQINIINIDKPEYSRPIEGLNPSSEIKSLDWK